MVKKMLLYFLIIFELFIITGCQKKIINDENVSNDTLENEGNIDNGRIDNDKKVDETDLYIGLHGTADTIDGTTVIISIYADDEVVNWNFDLESDIFKINDTLNNLNKATNYLTSEVSKYNKISEFIYDWHEFGDLKYEATFKDNIVDNYKEKYYTQKQWIIDNIDIIKIKKKYKADNIVFVYFFNTDNTNLAITSTYNREIDIVNIFPENSRYIIPPATYAHELLHVFGVPDLYFENSIINQNYVDYLQENGSNDIMFRVTDTEEIIDKFSDLDAYYAGLIDNHPDVEKWNLGISEHLINS